MRLIKKIFVVLIFLFSALVVAQPLDEAETERLLNEANNAYTLGKYEKAYEVINEALVPYQRSVPIPESVRLMAEAVYYNRIVQIYKNHDYTAFNRIEEDLGRYPSIVSDRISKKIIRIYTDREQDLMEKRSLALKQNRNRDWLYYDTLLEQLRQNEQVLQLRIEQGLGAVGTEFADQIEKARRTAAVIRVIFIIFVIAFVLAIFVAAGFLILTLERRRQRQKQFELTMRVVASLRRDAQEKQCLVAGGTIGVSAQPLTLTILSPDAVNAVSILTAADIPAIRRLDGECRALGQRIDRYTTRKNNARNVGELVYTLCRRLDVSEEISLLYYYASIVYDAGFLSVDREILAADHLTVEQRCLIRDHVQRAVRYYDFVPDRFLPVFIEAAEKHHENMDGSGYQEGLAGDSIPAVARLIRVAESYLSLTNYRLYHPVMDKDAALLELNRVSGRYDPSILAALAEIV
jgi:HD-GYP domain-containing protein (c-di-GMP phosphodiesterase class II)